MSIGTYSELLTAVANWLNRGDLTDRIPEFIALGEAQINRHLRVRRMLQRSYTTASTEFLSLPSDWVGMRNIDVTEGGTRYTVPYRTPEQMDMWHDGGTGRPKFYTILGSEFQLYPSPDTSYRLDISYYQSIPALTSTNTTNWLLTAHPDLYLFGCSAEALRYVQDKERYAQDSGRFHQIIKEIHKADKRDKYSGATLTMQPA